MIRRQNSLSSEAGPEPRCPYRQLATSVVISAHNDYIKAEQFLCRGKFGTLTRSAREMVQNAERDRDIARDFLLGLTDIAIFWMTAAGVSPLTQDDLIRIVQESK